MKRRCVKQVQGLPHGGLGGVFLCYNPAYGKCVRCLGDGHLGASQRSGDGTWAGAVPRGQHLGTVLSTVLQAFFLALALAPSQGLGEGLEAVHLLLEVPGALRRGLSLLRSNQPSRCCQGHLSGLHS